MFEPRGTGVHLEPRGIIIYYLRFIIIYYLLIGYLHSYVHL